MKSHDRATGLLNIFFFALGAVFIISLIPGEDLLFGLNGSPQNPLGDFTRKNSDGADMIQVIDSAGKNIWVPKNPQRIVVLPAYSMEIIRILGGMPRVVGTTHFIKTWVRFMPEVSELPAVGSSATPDLEAIARLKPDLVLAWKDFPGSFLEETLEGFGISVLRLDMATDRMMDRETRVLAELLGEEAKIRAERFISWNRDLEERLKSLVESPGVKIPTVLVEHYGFGNIAGRAAGCYATTVMAGADNLGKNISQVSTEMSGEWIIKQNPDFLVKIGFYMNMEERKNANKITEDLKNEILSRPGWNSIKAVREGKVFVLDEDLCGGPRGMVGAYTAAHHFHADLVGEDEGKKILRDYMERIQDLKPAP